MCQTHNTQKDSIIGSIVIHKIDRIVFFQMPPIQVNNTYKTLVNNVSLTSFCAFCDHLKNIKVMEGAIVNEHDESLQSLYHYHETYYMLKKLGVNMMPIDTAQEIKTPNKSTLVWLKFDKVRKRLAHSLSGLYCYFKPKKNAVA